MNQNDNRPAESQQRHVIDSATAEERRRRATHASLVNGLLDMADVFADAGPDAGLIHTHSCAAVHLSISRSLDGDLSERLGRIASIAGILGVPVTSRDLKNGGWIFELRREFTEHAVYMASTIVDSEAIAEAQAVEGGASR
jgi:hypothetical protein